MCKSFKFSLYHRLTISVDVSTRVFNPVCSYHRLTVSVDVSTRDFNPVCSYHRLTVSVDVSTRAFNSVCSYHRLTVSVDMSARDFNVLKMDLELSECKCTNLCQLNGAGKFGFIKCKMKNVHIYERYRNVCSYKHLTQYNGFLLHLEWC